MKLSACVAIWMLLLMSTSPASEERTFSVHQSEVSEEVEARLLDVLPLIIKCLRERSDDCVREWNHLSPLSEEALDALIGGDEVYLITRQMPLPGFDNQVSVWMHPMRDWGGRAVIFFEITDQSVVALAAGVAIY